MAAMPQFLRPRTKQTAKKESRQIKQMAPAAGISRIHTARRTKRLHLAFRRDVLREDTPWDGASAVPAGGLVTRSRAASGISLPAS